MEKYILSQVERDGSAIFCKFIGFGKCWYNGAILLFSEKGFVHLVLNNLRITCAGCFVRINGVWFGFQAETERLLLFRNVAFYAASKCFKNAFFGRSILLRFRGC